MQKIRSSYFQSLIVGQRGSRKVAINMRSSLSGRFLLWFIGGVLGTCKQNTSSIHQFNIRLQPDFDSTSCQTNFRGLDIISMRCSPIFWPQIFIDFHEAHSWLSNSFLPSNHFKHQCITLSSTSISINFWQFFIFFRLPGLCRSSSQGEHVIDF
jgi:hypothetical protein